MTEEFPLCLDATPNLLGFFDLTIAPPLLFYSYIPIFIIILFFGFFVLYKSKTLLSKLIFFISLSFALWIINILFQWTAIHANVVHFAWQLTALFEIPVFVLSLYFIHVYITKKDIGSAYKLILSALVLPVIILMPTTLNIKSFDLAFCEGTIGTLWDYIYALEVAIVVWIVLFGIREIIRKRSEENKIKIAISFIGTALFLAIFFLSNFVGEITQIYEFNLYGPIGAVIFLSLFTYGIVKYRTFNLKIFGTQALVVTLFAFVSGILFIQNVEYIRVVTAVTLIILTIVGWSLIKSVKREIEQREEIEKLAKDLQVANDRLKVLDKQKSEFVSLASHQLRGPLTSIRGYISLVLEGDFGKITKNTKEALEKVESSTTDLVRLVSDYLDVTRIELGKMNYEFKDVDLRKLIEEIHYEFLPRIEESGLKFVLNLEEYKGVTVNGDRNKLKQVISNLIDNSLKYTKEGSIKLHLEIKDKKAQILITDTGVGIPKDAIDELFSKFIRAENANKQNVKGTGLGLYIAKRILKEHDGEIWAESEGEGKGSTFTIELPLK